MNRVPIVFAFDNNFSQYAAVCIFSLLSNAFKNTFYDIFILSSPYEVLDHTEIDLVTSRFDNCSVTYRKVSDEFEDSFQIRGISCTTYYRLLIPELIPEYDRIIYSDVDVIFRADLSDIYFNTDIKDNYVAGVNAINHLIPELSSYYNSLGLDPQKTIYAGNLILNSKKLREDKVVERFKSMAQEKFRFQDMDIINIACVDRITYLSPEFCLTNYINDLSVNNRQMLRGLWSDEVIEEALKSGIVHYNGQKPWKGYCPSFDIWWEYYRNSPVFDEKFYFNFFYKKLDELDTLSFWKRLKVLARFFTVGRKR